MSPPSPARCAPTGASRIGSTGSWTWFHDDLARLRTGHGPENMATVKHMAINLVRQAKPTTNLKNRRKPAAWNPDYLETLLRQTA